MISDINSNISILDENISKTIDICTHINHFIKKINQKIRKLKSTKKCRIEKICNVPILRKISVKIKDDAINLNAVYDINKKILDLYNIIKYTIFKIMRKNIISLKSINSTINDEIALESIYLVNNDIKNLNKYNKKNLNKFGDAVIATKNIAKSIKNDINKSENNDDEINQNASLNGMFNNKIKPREFLQNKTVFLIYKAIICIIISGLQLYSILYPFLLGYFSIGDFFIIKLFLMKPICACNLIDICINWKKTKLTFIHHKVVLYIILVLYIIVFVASITVLIIISNLKIFPTIKNALYIDNNQIWFKYNNMSIKTDGFCSIKSHNNGTLKSDDFSMMTTLPRLYGITKEGKCYIKPSKRGLFNTTMKYIFGKNYEKDLIKIMCKKTKHNIYLVLTSEKILNQTLKIFSNKNITILNNQFNITNKNYFENFEISTYEQLPDYGKTLYNIYLNCKTHNITNQCENEWDTFTQYYWSNMFSDEYFNLDGFERYQINIEPNMIIQPSFIANENQLYSGMHYIIGGGYENAWNFGLLIETVGRKYIPLLIENFLPLYSFIRSIANDIFTRIEWINKHILYVQDFSEQEMKSISDLYNQFNFSHQSLFSIGHSITGTIFKTMSLSTDMNGIVFESSDSDTNFNYLDKSHFSKKSGSESLMTNIFSDGSIITGYDDKCNVNGILPKRYLLPNVYDTACLTSISYSNTMKYIPFCKQVLALNKKDPISEFNISFDAYLKHYGFK